MFDLGYGTACLDMMTRVSAHWPRRSVLWHGMLYGNASGACSCLWSKKRYADAAVNNKNLLSQKKVPVMRGGATLI